MRMIQRQLTNARREWEAVSERRTQVRVRAAVGRALREQRVVVGDAVVRASDVVGGVAGRDESVMLRRRGENMMCTYQCHMTSTIPWHIIGTP